MLRGLIILKTEKGLRYFIFLTTRNTFFKHEMSRLLEFSI